MKLAVLGLWHLGTVTAACTAAAGFPTVAIDDDGGPRWAPDPREA